MCSIMRSANCMLIPSLSKIIHLCQTDKKSKNISGIVQPTSWSCRWNFFLFIKGTNILTCASVTQRKDLKIREKRTKSMQTVIYVTEVSEMKKDANAKIES